MYRGSPLESGRKRKIWSMSSLQYFKHLVKENQPVTQRNANKRTVHKTGKCITLSINRISTNLALKTWKEKVKDWKLNNRSALVSNSSYTSPTGMTLAWTNPHMRHGSHKTQEGIILNPSLSSQRWSTESLASLNKRGTIKFRELQISKVNLKNPGYPLNSDFTVTWEEVRLAAEAKCLPLYIYILFNVYFLWAPTNVIQKSP